VTVKSASLLRPPLGAGGSPEPSLGRKLFIDAHASINVPSMEKWSTEQAFDPRLRQNCAQEFGGDVALQQAIAVLGKRRVIPHDIVNADANEPAEQKIELKPLHQLPLRADRIKRLQQHRPQQFLERDRGSTQLGVSAENSPDSPVRAAFTTPRIVGNG
jgi:hypothetical protein